MKNKEHKQQINKHFIWKMYWDILENTFKYIYINTKRTRKTNKNLVYKIVCIIKLMK